MARRCEGKPQDVEGNNTVGREVGWAKQKHNCGSRLVPGWFQGKKHICQGKNQGLKGKLTFWRKCEGKTDNQRIMQGKPLKHYNIPTLNGGSIGMSVW